MFQHLEDLYSSVSQYFPNGQLYGAKKSRMDKRSIQSTKQTNRF